MKLIAGLALFGILGWSGAVLAQDEAGGAKGGGGTATAGGGGDDNTVYKAKTVYDFEDDNVEGDLQRPDGELIDSVRKTQQSSLIEIRKDFIPEMLKSLEDV